MGRKNLTAWSWGGIVLLAAVLYLPILSWPLDKGVLSHYFYPLTFNLIDDIPTWILAREPNPHADFLRPVTHLFLYLEFLIAGYHPLGVRLTHLVLHLGAVLSLWMLARFLFGSTRWGILAAAIFAIHPNAVDAVILPTPQDLLATLFLLLGLIGWGKYLTQDRSGSAVRLSAIALLFSLALLAKELSLAFPLLALALHLTLKLQNRPSLLPLKRCWTGYLVLGVVVALYWAYRFAELSGAGGYLGSGLFSPNTLILRNMLRVVNGAFGIENQIAPLSALKIGPMAASLVALAITLWGIRPRRIGNPNWATAWGFISMFLAAATMLNIKWMGWWYMYLPLSCATMGIAGFIKEMAEKLASRLIFIRTVVVAIIALLALSTHQHLRAVAESREPEWTMLTAVRDTLLPAPGSRLYVLDRHVLLSFEHIQNLSHANVYPTTSSLFFAPVYDVVVMMDAPNGGILVGYNVKTLDQISIQPEDRVFSFHSRNGKPDFAPIEWDVVARALPFKDNSRR